MNLNLESIKTDLSLLVFMVMTRASRTDITATIEEIYQTTLTMLMDSITVKLFPELEKTADVLQTKMETMVAQFEDDPKSVVSQNYKEVNSMENVINNLLLFVTIIFAIFKAADNEKLQRIFLVFVTTTEFLTKGLGVDEAMLTEIHNNALIYKDSISNDPEGFLSFMTETLGNSSTVPEFLH